MNDWKHFVETNGAHVHMDLDPQSGPSEASAALSAARALIEGGSIGNDSDEYHVALSGNQSRVTLQVEGVSEPPAVDVGHSDADVPARPEELARQEADTLALEAEKARLA